MKNVLFVNACPRPESRTLELARAVLAKIEGEVQEIDLFKDGPAHLDRESLSRRDGFVKAKDYSDPMFRWAKQFAEADEIVIAAPYWDLMFPAVVRSYFEAVTVGGLTFIYSDDGIPKGLCKAKKLTYVTTAGGPIMQNYGFDYINSLAHAFYGIEDTACIKAEGLDIWGADVAGILAEVKSSL